MKKPLLSVALLVSAAQVTFALEKKTSAPLADTVLRLEQQFHLAGCRRGLRTQSGRCSGAAGQVADSRAARSRSLDFGKGRELERRLGLCLARPVPERGRDEPGVPVAKRVLDRAARSD